MPAKKIRKKCDFRLKPLNIRLKIRRIAAGEETLLTLLRQDEADEVRHQQYHDTDIVTVRVEASGAARGGGS